MGSSGGSSKSTSTNYTAAQAEWQKKALELYGPLMGQGQQIYPGETVAPMTDLQKQTLGAGQQFAGAFSPVSATDVPLYQETGDALKGIMTGTAGAQPLTKQQTSDYFKSVYEDPARKELQETLLPATREAYAGPGSMFGSGRAQEEIKQYRDTADMLSKQRGELEWNVLQSNNAIAEAKANRQLGAADTAMSYGSQLLRENLSRLTGTEELYNFATADQQQQQSQINAAIEKFEAGNRLTDPEVMQIMLTLLGQSYTTATQKTTPGSSGLGTAIGAGVGLLLAPVTGGASLLAGAGAGATAGSLF